MTSTTRIDPRSEVLAQAHAAVWTYAVLAAHAQRHGTPSEAAEYAELHQAHAAERDLLVQAMNTEGLEPPIAEAGYPVPARLDVAAERRSHAIELERQSAEVMAWAVAAESRTRRSWAVQALAASALRGAALRGTPEMFPGAADLSPKSQPLSDG